MSVTDDALRAVVTDYTREAGVRNLERELGKLLRKTAARDRVGDGDAADRHRRATTCSPRWAAPSSTPRRPTARACPGVATGLAVTGVGGDVLFIEATTMDGEGLTLTGQLGDVMKESAQIALSYVQAHADELGVDPACDAQRRVHLHVPAGGIPKDGPSAGITMTTALVSMLTGRTVKAGVGMTGEVTLQGRVLPIGGVKQKVLAAQRAGLDTVILPAAQRARPRRRARGGARRHDLPPGRRRARRAGARARGRAGRVADRGLTAHRDEPHPTRPPDHARF